MTVVLTFGDTTTACVFTREVHINASFHSFGQKEWLQSNEFRTLGLWLRHQYYQLDFVMASTHCVYSCTNSLFMARDKDENKTEIESFCSFQIMPVMNEPSSQYYRELWACSSQVCFITSEQEGVYSSRICILIIDDIGSQFILKTFQVAYKEVSQAPDVRFG